MSDTLPVLPQDRKPDIDAFISSLPPLTENTRKFAVRRFVKITAVVCDCGAVSHDRGVRKWKECPRCGAPVITSKDYEFLEFNPWRGVGDRLAEKYRRVQP